MPSSCHPCGPSFTSDFSWPTSPAPPSPSTLQPELVLSKMEICLRHPLLHPPQWLPSVLRCSPDALMCLFVSPSPSGPTDLPLTLWAAGTGASPGPMGSVLSLRAFAVLIVLPGTLSSPGLLTPLQQGSASMSLYWQTFPNPW